MLTTCSEPGCATIVMGGRCLEHERRPTRVFVRGRPFDGDEPDTTSSGLRIGTFAATGAVSSFDLPDRAQLPHELPRG